MEKNFPSVLDSASNPKNQIDEILIVDDGSTDDSVEMIRRLSVTSYQVPADNKKKPDTDNRSPVTINLIEHKKNLGYAAGCNTGVKAAKNELVAILNLDVVPENDFLVSAIPLFENKSVFSVSFNEGEYGPGRLKWTDGMMQIVKNNSEGEETDWPSGGSSIFRKAIWVKLGGMDELFLPFYWEDVDLGLRARRAGYKCLWEEKSKVEHKHEGSISTDNFKKKYLEKIKERNQILLTWKNIGGFSNLISHKIYLIKRCFSSPGYLMVIAMAISRRLKFSLLG